jgi:hypothetical protein
MFDPVAEAAASDEAKDNNDGSDSDESDFGRPVSPTLTHQSSTSNVTFGGVGADELLVFEPDTSEIVLGGGHSPRLMSSHHAAQRHLSRDHAADAQRRRKLVRQRSLCRVLASAAAAARVLRHADSGVWVAQQWPWQF